MMMNNIVWTIPFLHVLAGLVASPPDNEVQNEIVEESRAENRSSPTGISLGLEIARVSEETRLDISWTAHDEPLMLAVVIDSVEARRYAPRRMSTAYNHELHGFVLVRSIPASGRASVTLKQNILVNKQGATLSIDVYLLSRMSAVVRERSTVKGGGRVIRTEEIDAGQCDSAFRLIARRTDESMLAAFRDVSLLAVEATPANTISPSVNAVEDMFGHVHLDFEKTEGE